jgi:hypothetical protein
VGNGVHLTRHVAESPLHPFAVRQSQEFVGIQREDEISPFFRQRLPGHLRNAQRLLEGGLVVVTDLQRQSLAPQIRQDLCRAIERAVVDDREAIEDVEGVADVADHNVGLVSHHGHAPESHGRYLSSRGKVDERDDASSSRCVRTLPSAALP